MSMGGLAGQWRYSGEDGGERGWETYGWPRRVALGVLDMVWRELQRTRVQRRQERLGECDF